MTKGYNSINLFKLESKSQSLAFAANTCFLSVLAHGKGKMFWSLKNA